MIKLLNLYKKCTTKRINGGLNLKYRNIKSEYAYTRPTSTNKVFRTARKGKLQNPTFNKLHKATAADLFN